MSKHKIETQIPFSLIDGYLEMSIHPWTDEKDRLCYILTLYPGIEKWGPNQTFMMKTNTHVDKVEPLPLPNIENDCCGLSKLGYEWDMNTKRCGHYIDNAEEKVIKLRQELSTLTRRFENDIIKILEKHDFETCNNGASD